MGYLWLKAFHIISLIAWYAGIFYIWRLFVYHSMSESAETREVLAVMERKLLKLIMKPAAVSTLVFGIWMFILQWEAFHTSYWIWMKITLVLLVVFQHIMAEYYRRRLADGVQYPHKFFRIWNEVPTLLLIGIVLLVVLKPF